MKKGKPPVTYDTRYRYKLDMLEPGTIVSEKGVEALTAKELGDALGASARPIFTVFASRTLRRRAEPEKQKQVHSAFFTRYKRPFWAFYLENRRRTPWKRRFGCSRRRAF